MRTRIKIITRTRPRPPLGAYPQPRLYGHEGNAPSNNKTKIINRIVPMITQLSKKELVGQRHSNVNNALCTSYLFVVFTSTRPLSTFRSTVTSPAGVRASRTRSLRSQPAIRHGSIRAADANGKKNREDRLDIDCLPSCNRTGLAA